MAKVTLIKRSAPGCPACLTLQTILNGEGIEHTTVDITTDKGAVEKYDVTSVPTLVIERDNGSTVRMYGVQPSEAIKEAIGGVGE
ncbi:thioredoxin family protein [Bacillus sp. 7894-2]|uniref:thioredoxin family protein n=1 Tax=Bacillus sp. 7894-2 TaxID=2021695 RepID=UPI000BA77D57|nr:thioredoxin family protein [Bacillus sp. 7894-2]PAE24029.1 hypothetical protein CHI10_14585 [Bacillus sp. 7894-2]